MSRTKILTPELLLKTFKEYNEHTKNNPILIKDWVGGMAKEIVREKERPLTMEGFEIYCTKKKLITDLKHYFANSRDAYGSYIEICSIIKKTIRADQIEGGMCGIYNPSITQRLNNLSEKVEQMHVEQPLF